MTPTEEMMHVLERALSVKRRASSEGEMAFVAWLARRLPITAIDEAGNVHVDMRTKPAHKTLFVAHTDTMHRGTGPNLVDKSTSQWKADGDDVLGADDGAGVAVLCGLIKAGVPGYYIFTRSEERGGVGAIHLSLEHAELLVGFDRAVAVDRKDVFSVITHQFAGRCCSTAFADALCDELNALGMMMMPDDTGVYTDTAEFMELIPECTNISAGYNREHTPHESLDTEYLQQLLAAMVQVKWDALPVERDPEDGDAEDLQREMQDELSQWQAAWDRWRDEMQDEEFDNLDVREDPFAWSDDGKTINYGSGKRRMRSLS